MKLRAALVVTLALAAAGCGTSRTNTVELPGGVAPTEPERAPGALERMLGMDSRPNVGPCPLMGVLYDNSRQVDFAASGQQRYANIEYTGEMQAIRGLCRYVDDDPITMSIEVDMAFGRGPAATSRRHTYRYWVAVTRRGVAPIAREFFEVEVDFGADQQTVTRTERIEHIVIPRANSEISGENFEILVGFELTPEELEFNREGRRFRIDAGG